MPKPTSPNAVAVLADYALRNLPDSLSERRRLLAIIRDAAPHNSEPRAQAAILLRHLNAMDRAQGELGLGVSK